MYFCSFVQKNCAFPREKNPPLTIFNPDSVKILPTPSRIFVETNVKLTMPTMSLIEPIQPITMDHIFKQQDEFLVFGKEQCNAMWQKVREQLDCSYNQEQPDDAMLTYLEAIEAELSRIAMYLK